MGKTLLRPAYPLLDQFDFGIVARVFQSVNPVNGGVACRVLPVFLMISVIYIS